jgi:tRNA (adenine22-N1)-methyltransferase
VTPTKNSLITRRLGRTPRIHALAACVPHTTRVFVDIGTNHGILPIAVVRARRARRCIAIDLSPVAIAETARRIQRCDCAGRIDLRQGDGLDVLDASEAHAVDVICIAGLGPHAIVNILARGLPRLSGQRVRLVLHPLGSSAAPRTFLAEHGFELTDDTTVEEHGRCYTILVAEQTATDYCNHL